ncbi:MAG: hypothetical protein ABI442_17845 [Gemmatimonadaceae bacterium]
MVEGSVTLSGALTTAASSILRVQGINTFGAGSLTVSSGFTNNGTIELTELIAGYGASLTVTMGTLVNASGALISPLQGFGGGRTLAAQIDNQSTITIGDTQGLTLARAGAVSTNSGTIAITAGSLTLNQTGTTPSFTSTGTVAISGGLFWTVNGGGLNLSGGTTNGAGVLALNGVNVAFTTAAVTTPFQFSAATTVVGGIVTIPSGHTMTIVGGVLAAPVTNQGLLVIEGGVTLSGTLTTTAGSILRMQGINTYGAGSLSVVSGFTNLGTIELTELVAEYGASLAVTTGTLVNAPGSVISPLAGFGGPRTLAAQIDNQSTITIGDAQGLTLGRAGLSARTAARSR